MGLKDIFIGAGEEIIKYIFQIFETALGGIIRGLLQFLTDVITRTPYPKQCPQSLSKAGECTLDNTPLVFGVPQDALWGNLYSIYVTDAQPFAYVLWMFALISVQFSGIFDGLVPGIDTEESKKKLMVAFLGITLWWPAGVMILGFSDAFGTLLLELGTPGQIPEDEKASIGLAKTYDVVMANLESNLNIHGLIITTILWFIELLILMVLAILWFIRVAAIYILMPLMPVWIALWALEIPGLKPLQKLGKMQITMFNTLAFITIPGALIVGFYGTIIDIAARYTEEVTGATVTTDGVTSGNSYDGSVSEPGVIESQPSATADPVGSFSSAVQPDPATTSAALDATTQAQAGEFAAGYIASFVFAIVIMSLPLVAGLAPVLMAKSIPGGKEILSAAGPVGTALGGPVGALAGAAVSAAGKADKANALRSRFKTGKEDGWGAGWTDDGEKDEQSAVAEALGFDTGGGSSRLKKTNTTDYAGKIKSAMTAEGLALGAGASIFSGKKAAKTGKQKAGAAATKASELSDDAREGAWSAYRGAHAVNQNRQQFLRHASENASNAADRVISPIQETAHENFNKAERELAAHNLKKNVSGFAARNYSTLQAVKNGETAVHKRARDEKRAAQDYDDLDIAQMASVIAPHASSMTEEQATNLERHDVAKSDAKIDAMRDDAPSIEVPEIKWQSKNEVSLSAVKDHTGRPPEEMAADAVESNLMPLLNEAQTAFEDVELDYVFHDDGRMELTHNLNEDQLNTELGQEIQDLYEQWDGMDINDMDIDAVIEDSNYFEELQEEMFSEHIQAVETELAEQVAEQMDLGFDIGKHINHETGHIPSDVKDQMVTAINKHGDISASDFDGDMLDYEVFKEAKTKEDNADMFKHVSRSL